MLELTLVLVFRFWVGLGLSVEGLDGVRFGLRLELVLVLVLILSLLFGLRFLLVFVLGIDAIFLIYSYDYMFCSVTINLGLVNGR